MNTKRDAELPAAYSASTENGAECKVIDGIAIYKTIATNEKINLLRGQLGGGVQKDRPNHKKRVTNSFCFWKKVVFFGWRITFVTRPIKRNLEWSSMVVSVLPVDSVSLAFHDRHGSNLIEKSQWNGNWNLQFYRSRVGSFGYRHKGKLVDWIWELSTSQIIIISYGFVMFPFLCFFCNFFLVFPRVFFLFLKCVKEWILFSILFLSIFFSLKKTLEF